MEEYTESTVFVTGVARPAKDDPIASTYQMFFLSLIIDKDTDIVVDVTCNAARIMTENFIRSLLVGQNLAEGIEDMVQVIRYRFFGLVQKALIVALKDAHNRYMMVKKNNICEITVEI